MSILVSLIKELVNQKRLREKNRAIRALEIAEQEQAWLKNADEYYAKILAIDPNNTDALYNLGQARWIQESDEAIRYFQKVLELDSTYYAAQTILLHLMQQRCEWNSLGTETQQLRTAVRAASISGGKSQIPPFFFLALPGTTAKEQRQCAETYSQIIYPQQHVASLRRQLGFDFKRPSGEKIRLGYLSADFYDHATARLMAEIFELHDRTRFHVTAYSSCPDDGSTMRRRLEDTFDDFVDIQGDSLTDAAKRIYANRTDILIDLKGHTTNTRSGILALCPAPIQVNYLGYPGTMGADFVDYIIADRFIIPPEQAEHYTEKVVWLPDCYQPNDRSRPRPKAPTRTQCGLPEEGFVFCCFNQTYKITPEVFDVWCELLKSVPDSYLWVLTKNSQAEDNLRREAQRRGLDPARLIMAPMIHDGVQHLARLQCADLFLDTIPYNAHTTCSDALWMGLPVLTCVGETFSSRVAGSLLTALGVPELITYNLADYSRLALNLATDRNNLAAIRRKIIAKRDTAPLFDSTRFTRNLESAYVQMMEESKGKWHG